MAMTQSNDSLSEHLPNEGLVDCGAVFAVFLDHLAKVASGAVLHDDIQPVNK
jgi:hypothetical protein